MWFKSSPSSLFLFLKNTHTYTHIYHIQSLKIRDTKVFSKQQVQNGKFDVLISQRTENKMKGCFPDLFLNNLNHIFVTKIMTKTTMLWVVPCTNTPDQNILHILHQTSVYMVAEVFYSAATSILQQFLPEKVTSLYDGLEDLKKGSKGFQNS